MSKPLFGVLAASLLLLASCAASLRPPAFSPVATAGPVCRVGPDGGPLRADRGIGGTGAPPLQQADKGIGGTGIERTGLVGVITGFASICVGGSEVAYGPATDVLLDRQPAGAADMRAGQIAAVDAVGPADGLQATRVQIRHEAVGPVQAVEPGGTLVVAGQPIQLAPTTLGTRPALGDWVAVSGFRDSQGVVQATRIDPQAPGRALIAGAVVQDQGQLRIGQASIRPPAGLPGAIGLQAGQQVIAAGRWSDEGLVADAVAPDLLAAGPYGYFPAGTGIVIVERFAGVSEGRLVVDRLEQRGPGLTGHRATISLERWPDGGLRPAITRPLGGDGARAGQVSLPAAGLRDLSGPARPGPARTFEPAPVPSGLSPAGAGRPGSGGPGERDLGRGERGRDRAGPTEGGPGLAPSGGLSGPYVGGGFGAVRLR